MRIIKIKLENFQIHRGEVEIRFAPTITTIRGPTDVGKSAILRALRWTCLNDIPGDDFISEGEKRVAVSLDVVLGKVKHAIKRIRQRGGSVNTYELDGEEFKSFGSSVPTPIARILNLNQINFQGQHDSPYWFSETAGEVSRQLNSVIDLSIIDSSLSNIASALRQAADRRNICQERLEESTAQLKEVRKQKPRIQEFRELEELSAKEKIQEERCSVLLSLLLLIKSNRAKEWAQRVEDAETAFAVARRAVIEARRTNLLKELIEEVLEKETIQSPPAFDSITQSFEACITLRKRAERLSDLLQRTYEAAFAKDATEAAAQCTEDKFHQEIKGMKCPTCGQIVEEEL
jgi:DNA repair ATPase RecN